MTQEDKELLLKDLCARLDTNLVCSIYRTDDEGVGYRDEILHGYCKGDIWYEFYFREDCSIGIDNVSKIKPYLFPFSSITDEQKSELNKKFNVQFSGNDIYSIHYHSEGYWDTDLELDLQDWLWFINWCYKNHFDVNNLIEKGLALDATVLNIY